MESSRPATPQDVDRLLELAELARRELITERGGSLWAQRESPPQPRRSELLDAMTDTHSCLLVGCVDRYPAGFGLIRQETLRNGDKLGVVSDIYVEPGFRGVSVGEAVMVDLLAWARERGCIGVDSLVLPGMRDSKNFFERFTMKARALIVHHAFEDPGPTHGTPAAEPIDDEPPS